MKLRNKKTGEIADLIEIVRIDGVSNEFYLRLSDKEGRTFKVGINSLTKLNEEWEDAPEEPKEYWYIDYDGGILCGESDNSSAEKMMISMGNHFETIKEAEKAVEKLKAWKRLKDKGFKFDGWTSDYGKLKAWFKFDKEAWLTETKPDLDLLFGGEE